MSDTASRLPACRGDGAAHQISPRDFTNSRTGPRSWGHRHWRSSLGSVSGSSMPTAAGSVRKRPERETAFLEKSRKQFECAICLELSLPYKEPRVLPCSHVFDRACLERVVQLAEQAGTAVHSCPECAQRFSRTQIKDLQEDKFAWRTLMNLLIPCPLECSWEGDVGDLDTHFNSCEKGKCADCGAVVRPPDTLEEHAEDCPKAVLACDNEGCSVEVTRDLLDAHFEVCPHEILSCESRGCDHECKRSMMKRHMTSAKDRHLALLNELLVNHEKELASLRPVALPVKGQRHAFYDEFYVEVPPPNNAPF
ncbi:hypothetical protein DFJ74DRAFT_500814 [Hyaloraphidium curvatum]|nr:hypothetical protein DFJ74DRAFT_500814 [Hyaloraphidium curvatum]